MQKSTISWDDLLTLSTLMRAGSYSACARELDITHATAIRRIRRLETALGKPVATRADGTFVLTAAGRNALIAARQMEQSADRLLREIEGVASGVSGVVRVAATAAMGTCLLTPRLPALYAANPEAEVRLELDNRVASLARRRAHIAVRLARPQEDTVVAQRAGTVHFGLYAPAGMTVATALASDTPLCGLLDEGFTLPEVEWPKSLNRRFAFQSNSLLAVSQAVRTGLGVALLPHYLAAGDPGLTLAQDVPEVTREIWLAYPAEFRGASRFRPVIDWLVEALAECR
ncbi:MULTISPECIES: LysR family transcriptional regulator [Cupriavidus]|uniref:Transcriptional regulatory protein, LysR family, substrate-binding protein n=1 Tax=Cupriavidus metallidurans (strain ATCC 43123 / DSM 2839 / NBRC 102507 / CH34) TaxID=266264 RepID=Q1LL71_CUPMC|nr:MULTISPECIES: LysR family transcriptional regulator [Cupriavidus]ABF09105.1 Transcriptional regulatory protein, LysR family, substrate-binding protein [Cupriavidus metallidurans CH34]ELA01016.1 LysR family transcriptional regulator [Cupriavidus sp. HMR-1]QGS30008.1 LysR family transcriptional regulator [Cupriavidus metallidurans]UBM09926.1 LysR family transcriptional regulator [Cupriavidus metallidurans]